VNTCPFCNRPVAGDCRRPSCRFRTRYLKSKSLLPAPPLDMDESELPPEPVTTREIDGVTYDVVFSGELQRRNLCPCLSSCESPASPLVILERLYGQKERDRHGEADTDTDTRAGMAVPAAIVAARPAHDEEVVTSEPGRGFEVSEVTSPKPFQRLFLLRATKKSQAYE
jgi:hypothetical protein